MARKRIFGVLSVRTVQGDVRAAYGLGFRERIFYEFGCVKQAMKPGTLSGGFGVWDGLGGS